MRILTQEELDYEKHRILSELDEDSLVANLIFMAGKYLELITAQKKKDEHECRMWLGKNVCEVHQGPCKVHEFKRYFKTGVSCGCGHYAEAPCHAEPPLSVTRRYRYGFNEQGFCEERHFFRFASDSNDNKWAECCSHVETATCHMKESAPNGYR